MLNPFIWLLLLSITMLVGSFIFGCIPLATKLSENKLRQLTAIGVGLLIGTSLVVIIPEGVETLYSSPARFDTASTMPPTITTATTASIYGSPSLLKMMETTTTPQSATMNAFATTTPVTSHMTIEDPNRMSDSLDKVNKKEESDHHHSQDSASPKHTSVGFALILGFGVMFLIDQFSSLHVHTNNGNNHRVNHDHELDSMLTVLRSPKEDDDVQEDLDNRWNNANSTGASSIASNDHHHHHHHQQQHARSMTPTIGLMVHAAADGIALGASASHPQLSMVVFFAIMLHKGPSAFALTTVLLAEGFSRLQVRKHLLLFSMAAPTGALTTYLLLSMTSPGDVSLEYWTGVLLLFSGGTFLYVAMHALQELQPSLASTATASPNGSSLSSNAPSSITASSAHTDKLSQSDVICILCGMFLPVLLNLGHSH